MGLKQALTGGLAVCALALALVICAQSASAAGTTAFTCEKLGLSHQFGDAHCKTEATEGEWAHVAIANDTLTNLRVNNLTTGTERSTGVLKSTIAGSGIKLEAKKVLAFGTMSNKLEAGEMYASGEVEKVVFEEVAESSLGCTVTGKPGGAGKIESAALKATTKAQGDALLFEPAVGLQLAEFELTECAVGPITIKVFGSVKGVPTAATTTFNEIEVTAAKTLRLQNAKTGPFAGLEGSITLNGTDADNPGTSEWPLSFTT